MVKKQQGTLDGFVKSKTAAKKEVESLGGEGLPPVTDIREMFTDLVQKATQFKEVVEKLNGRKLRVATMCSGTESPLLALRLIARAVRQLHGLDFEVEHVFSCEIEPFKQAYIERNFSPPILFRDVCELGEDQATTAYGAKVDVPGNIDMLVAGTSCVDYSNLNKKKKTGKVAKTGESGRTFNGMLNWVKKHKPKIVIIENVSSAPWEDVLERFEKIKYNADWTRFDTKNYYIPHTRLRGYLFATTGSSKIAKAWIPIVKSMERAASSPLEAFLLPTDDPRIHQARMLLGGPDKIEKRRGGKVDWVRCESRHQRARAEEELGDKRPLTAWEEGGVCKLPDTAWTDWGTAQTDRVLDLMDINYLRSAADGVDTNYKTMLWNLSQNVDRSTSSSKPGICPCLTPNMIPYVTYRGGPVIGLEALSLQGLPVNELLLTRETEDNLSDLAGNAMSTTVVGACMVAALISSVSLLVDDEDDDQEMSEKSEELKPNKIDGESELKKIEVNLLERKNKPVSELITNATRSARICACEGRVGTTSNVLRRCQDCNYTSCVKCGGRPEHNYTLYTAERLGPQDFEKQIKQLLPMRLNISNITEKLLDDAAKEKDASFESTKNWKAWKTLVVTSLKDVEFKFRSLRRQVLWNVIYEAPSATLELALDPKCPEWRLYVKPADSEPVKSFLRQTLTRPVARMLVSTKSSDLLQGQWEVCLPVVTNFTVQVNGKGSLVPTWEARIGLKGKSTEKQCWSQLEISEVPDTVKAILDQDISGSYTLFEKCGTAMSSLHKKDNVADNKNQLYLFFDPAKSTKPNEDHFVFSTSIDRPDFETVEYGRQNVAIMDPSWRPNSKQSSSVKCTVNGMWTLASKVALAPPKDDGTALVSMPAKPLAIELNATSCCTANAILTCKAPINNAEQMWNSTEWKEIDLLHDGRKTFEALAWLTERIPSMDTLQDWITIKKVSHDVNCERCAPSKPEHKWKQVGNALTPVEDTKQAGAYEQALKQRPTPFTVQLRMQDEVGSFRIGLNIATLIHRALSRLPKGHKQFAPIVSWRLNPSLPFEQASFPKFILSSNRKDKEHAQPPHFKHKLRPEQLRSLTWMVEQEQKTEATFIEEEISEAILEHIGWRAEGKAERPVLVRGGVLADQVGFGKTATTLALISAAGRDIPHVTKEEEFGLIPVKGTVVIVPAHLSKQWPSEIQKFLGSSMNVVSILNVAGLNKLTIKDIEKADIIVVASTVFNSEKYFTNINSLSCKPGLKKTTNQRFFDDSLDSAILGLKRTVENFKTMDSREAVESLLKRMKKAKNASLEEEEEEEPVNRRKQKNSEEITVAKEVKSDKRAKEEEIKPKKAEEKKPKPKKSTLRIVKKDKTPEKKKETPSNTGTIDSFFSSPSKELRPRKPKQQSTVVEEPKPQAAKRKRIIFEDSDDEEVEVRIEVSDDEENPRKKIKANENVAVPVRKVSDKTSDDEDDDFKPTEESEDEDYVFDNEVKEDDVESEDEEEKVKVVQIDEDEDEEDDIEVKVKEPKKKATKKTVAAMEEGDPWGLETSKVKDNWKNMKRPPLQMFHFQRIVVDEFTYLKGTEHSMVTKLEGSFRWCLSGTPPVADFAAVKSIAAFLGVQLGIDDSLAPVKAREKYLSAAEKFHAFREMHSMAWHARRHQVAQSFLDSFVRQNVAEIDEIPSEESIRKINLHAAERAIYLELEHYLQALEMNARTIKGNKKGDREQRLAQALGESQSAEEALIKRCSHFDLDLSILTGQTTSNASAEAACDLIIKVRTDQLIECKIDIRNTLTKIHDLNTAINRMGGYTKEDKQEFQDWKLDIENHGIGDYDATVQLKELINASGASGKNFKLELKTTTISKNSNPRNKGATDKKKAAAKKGKKKATKKKKDESEDEEEEEEKEEEEEIEEEEEEEEKKPASLADKKWELREVVHILRRLQKELTGRVRSLRYFNVVRDVQQSRRNKKSFESISNCSKCGKENLTLSNLAVLSCCGHTGCHDCIKEHADHQECIKNEKTGWKGCKAAARSTNVIKAENLGLDRETTTGKFGTKLAEMVQLINVKIPKSEKVLIFVQFPDLLEKVAEALQDSKIDYTVVEGSANKQSTGLQNFQDGKVRVLLLNVTDAKASGANLTIANHAIFLSPLLTETQDWYIACETQAIGRVVRYGQTKKVHIYRFVTENTIDQDIFEQRRGEKL